MKFSKTVRIVICIVLGFPSDSSSAQRLKHSHQCHESPLVAEMSMSSNREIDGNAHELKIEQRDKEHRKSKKKIIGGLAALGVGAYINQRKKERQNQEVEEPKETAINPPVTSQKSEGAECEMDFWIWLGIGMGTLFLLVVLRNLCLLEMTRKRKRGS